MEYNNVIIDDLKDTTVIIIDGIVIYVPNIKMKSNSEIKVRLIIKKCKINKYRNKERKQRDKSSTFQW